MKVGFFLIATLLVSKFQAQNIVFKSLQDVQNRAISANISIQQSEINQKLARADQRISVSTYLPSVNLTANSDYNINLPVQLIPSEFFGGQPGTYQEAQFGRDWNSTANVDFSQPIIHADKYAQIKAAGYSKEESKLNQETLKRQVLQRVSMQYLTILVLQESLKLNRELDSTSIALFESTKARFDRQLVSQIDINRAENLMHQTKQQTNQIAANLQLALVNLSVSLGISSNQNFDIQDRISNYQSETKQLNLPEINQIQATNRPAVKAAEQNIMASQWKYRQQTYAMLPKLSLNSRYSFSSQGDNWLGNGSNNFDYGTVGISLSMPIFKGRSSALNSKKALYQLENARFQKEQTLLNASQELQEWQIKLNEKNASKQLASRRDEMARQTLNLSLQSYDQGVITLDALFNIYNEYVVARNSLVQNTADAAMYKVYLDLEK
jgi:outer membrane protein TolC